MNLAQFRGSFVVAARSHNALASPATALVGLPVMQTLLVVGAVSAAGGRDLALTAQATVLVGTVTFTAASISVQTAMDRVTGVAGHVVPYGLLRPPAFAGKISLGVLLTLPVTAIQLTGVGLTGAAVWKTAMMVPVALLVGAVLGVALSLWSFSAKDPFAVANVVPYLLPITSGAAVPLTSYPFLLQIVGALMPGAGLAAAARGIVPVGVGIVWEVMTSGGWLLVVATRAARISARVRDGRLSSDVL